MLDCRKSENREIIQKVLKKIKPFSKYDESTDVPLEMVEMLIHKLTNKYFIRIQWINHSSIPFRGEEEFLWSVSMKRDDTHAWVGNVTGLTLYEMAAKTAIKMFSITKNGDIPERPQSWYEERARRMEQYKNKE